MPDLKDAIERVRLFYDPTREPLRRRVYTALLTLVGVGVAAGIVSGALAVSIGTAGAAVLMVPAVEYARRAVTPIADPNLTDTPGRHAVDRSQ